MEFCLPVGSAKAKTWPPPNWVRTNWYLASYYLSGKLQKHTGDDLIYSPSSLTKGQPVYAMMDGLVTFSGRLPGTWGNVLIIRHTIEGVGYVYSRAAHLASIEYKKNDYVLSGSEVGNVGDTGMPGVPHLHLDVSALNNDTMLNSPGDWPGTNEKRIRDNYQSPTLFIRGHLSPPETTRFVVIAKPWLNIRKMPTINSPIVGQLPHRTAVIAKDRAHDDLGRRWRLVNDGSGWIAEWLIEPL